MHTFRLRGRPRAALLFGATLVLFAPAVRAADSEVERLRRELSQTRQELSTTRQQLSTANKNLESTQSALDALTRRVDAIEQAESAAAAPPAETTARITPVNADNPGVSVVVDTAFSQDVRDSWKSIGYPNGADFSLKNGELFVSAPIDPFLRGYISINGTSDQGFDIEEAALVTTALPWNLTAKGGRFFADVGRLPHWHDEGLPFVDRPPSIDRMIGGESKAEGLEISWLAPLDQYLELVGGVYDGIGADLERPFFGRRDAGELTFLARPHTYFDLTDTLNLELGGTWFGQPQNSARNLFGVDATLRHQPGTSALYQGFVLGAEWLWNDQLFVQRDAAGVFVDQMRHHRQGGYGYFEGFLGRSYSGGVRFDYSESPGSFDADPSGRDLARTVSAFVTWKPSEFHRLRFQFDDTWGDQPSNQRFTVQWTAFIGSHSHGFAQR